jgi:hypothetical protein
MSYMNSMSSPSSLHQAQLPPGLPLVLPFVLDCEPQQHAQLLALQRLFAQACNELTLQVAQSRVWNRVALHHLHYRSLRQKYPQLGSQMVCNVIYAVSRTARMLYQSPQSPYYLHKLGDAPLPRLLFSDRSPVYFDSHTLSLKQRAQMSQAMRKMQAVQAKRALQAVQEGHTEEGGAEKAKAPGLTASMFTLEGRTQFTLPLEAPHQVALANVKLKEIVLRRRMDDRFMLVFGLAADEFKADDLPGVQMHEAQQAAQRVQAGGTGEADERADEKADAEAESGLLSAHSRAGRASVAMPSYVSLEGV